MNALTQRQKTIRSRQLRDGGWLWKHRRRVLIWWAVAFWACAPAWAATDPPSAADVYKNRCASCHGVDGENPKLLVVFPDLPNFKDRNWQKVHTSTVLRNVILHGGKDGMPGFENDLDGVTTDQMVQYLRQFAPRRRESASGKPSAPPTAGRVLQGLLRAVPWRQWHGTPQLHVVFPALPDFTSPQWQAAHPMSEMKKVILHGGTEGMPAFEGDLEGLDITTLTRYLRTFAQKQEEEKKK